MNIKEMYKYTLENKWKPILRKEIDIYKFENICVFCAESIGNEEEFIKGSRSVVDNNCLNCRVDRKICTRTDLWEESGCLLGQLEITISNGDIDGAYEIVEEIIEVMESHLD